MKRAIPLVLRLFPCRLRRIERPWYRKLIAKTFMAARIARSRFPFLSALCSRETLKPEVPQDAGSTGQLEGEGDDASGPEYFLDQRRVDVEDTHVCSDTGSRIREGSSLWCIFTINWCKRCVLTPAR